MLKLGSVKLYIVREGYATQQLKDLTEVQQEVQVLKVTMC